MEHSLEVEVKKSIVDLESVSVAPSDSIFMEFYYSSWSHGLFDITV